jgi:hypothetical protein
MFCQAGYEFVHFLHAGYHYGHVGINGRGRGVLQCAIPRCGPLLWLYIAPRSPGTLQDLV